MNRHEEDIITKRVKNLELFGKFRVNLNRTLRHHLDDVYGFFFIPSNCKNEPPEYLVSSSYDRSLRVLNLRTRNVESMYRNEAIVLKLFHLEEFGKVFVCDWDGKMLVFELAFNREEQRLKLDLIEKIKIGETRNEFYEIIQKPNSNVLVTFCWCGNENKGDIRIIKYCHEQLRFTISVTLLLKYEEHINAACFSLKPTSVNDHNIMYFGGGDDEGNDYSLKKYDFESKKTTEFQSFKNDSPIDSIFSILKNKDELLFFGNFGFELFILKNETLCWKTKLEESVFCYCDHGSNFLFFGGGTNSKTKKTGNLYLLNHFDLNDVKVKKLTNDENMHKGWMNTIVYSPFEKKVYTCGYDGEIKVMKIIT